MCLTVWSNFLVVQLNSFQLYYSLLDSLLSRVVFFFCSSFIRLASFPLWDHWGLSFCETMSVPLIGHQNKPKGIWCNPSTFFFFWLIDGNDMKEGRKCCAQSLIFKLQPLRVIIFLVKFLSLPCFWCLFRLCFDIDTLWLWVWLLILCSIYAIQ